MIHTPPTPCRRRPDGFSLIELLVVVAIIGVLIALTLPSLSNARDVARGAVCLSNQRQFRLGISAYNDDHRTWYPTGGRSYHTEWHCANWSGAVAHYLGIRYYTEWQANSNAYPNIMWVSQTNAARNTWDSMLRCPSDPGFLNTWSTRAAVSYGWNDADWGLGVNDSYTVGLSGTAVQDRPTARRRIRDSDILAPATTLMTGDHRRVSGQYEHFTGQLLNPSTTSLYHAGGTNVLWADGHGTRETEQTLTQNDFDRRR